MHYDSFEENIQVEEIIPAEYEDWLNSLIEEDAEEYATEAWSFEEDENAAF